ncbi:MAG: hypothetical protein AAFP19_23645, partial [Bacteroidota bacterium]
MKTVSDDLFQLIQSMSKQEKRYFKLQASMHRSKGNNNYLRLFEAIDRQTAYDEDKIRKKFEGEAFLRQLHVAKNYLYKLIINSLRLYQEAHNEDKFPLLMRNAQILYSKGLYKQSEKMLEKARKLALENERYLQLLEVFRWKHHNIHSKSDFKALERYLNVDFQQELKLLDIYRNFLEFRLLHDRVFISYWKKGSIRKQEEKEALSQLFEYPLYQSVNQAQSFNARMFYHNARFTYYFLIGELDHCYQHIKALVVMFEDLPKNRLKGAKEKRYISSLINLHIIQKQLQYHQESLQSLRKLRSIPARSMAQKARLVTRSYNLELALYLSTGQFGKAIDNMALFE